MHFLKNRFLESRNCRRNLTTSRGHKGYFQEGEKDSVTTQTLIFRDERVHSNWQLSYPKQFVRFFYFYFPPSRRRVALIRGKVKKGRVSPSTARRSWEIIIQFVLMLHECNFAKFDLWMSLDITRILYFQYITQWARSPIPSPR